MLDLVVCSREQFSFQMCLESGDGRGTFRNWRQSSRQLMSWYWMLWIESWSLSPPDRVVVDWRISRVRASIHFLCLLHLPHCSSVCWNASIVLICFAYCLFVLFLIVVIFLSVQRTKLGIMSYCMLYFDPPTPTNASSLNHKRRCRLVNEFKRVATHLENLENMEKSGKVCSCIWSVTASIDLDTKCAMLAYSID